MAGRNAGGGRAQTSLACFDLYVMTREREREEKEIQNYVWGLRFSYEASFSVLKAVRVGHRILRGGRR